MASKVEKQVIIAAIDRVSAPMRLIQSKFANVQSQMQALKRQSIAVGKSIAQIAVPVMALGGAMAVGIKKISDYQDEMLTLAGIIKMPVESLQKLRYAAIQNDVAAESFDKSLEFLNKNMGQLKAGTGALKTILEKTNPSFLKQLRNAKDNESAFRMLMQEMHNLTDANDQAALATAAFGKSGQKLISLANIGADEMAKWESEAEKFGIATEKDAAAADEMNKALDRAKFALTGLALTISSKIIPALTPLINKFSDFIANNKELIAVKVEQIFESIIIKVKTLTAVMAPLMWVLSNCTWLLGVLFYAKVAQVGVQIYTLGEILTTGVIPAIWRFSSGIFLAVKALIAGGHTLAVFRALLGGKLFWALAGAIKWIRNLTVVQWLFNAALWANPITWIIAGIVALGAAALLIYKYWEPISEFFSNLWAGIKNAFKAGYEFIKNIFIKIKEMIMDSWFGKAFRFIYGDVLGLAETNGEYNARKKGHSSNLQLSDYGAGNNMSLAPNRLSNSINQNQIAGADLFRTQSSADIAVHFANAPAGTQIMTNTAGDALNLSVYRGGNGGVLQ